MSLKEQINADLKTAMKARDAKRTSVLRMLLSELNYAQAAVNVHQELPNDEVLKVITTYHKRLAKSLDDYPEGEKRQAIQDEMIIAATYLPKKAEASEVARVVDEIFSSTDERNFGVLMKEAMTRLGTSGDGKLVSQILKQKLG